MNEIAEMAKFICNACEMGGGFRGECADGNDYKTCGISVETARALSEAGYRRSPDVAREIFAEIERMTAYFTAPNGCALVSLSSLEELKKKYTEVE